MTAHADRDRSEQPTERAGRPKINTDAVRGVVRAKIADMERHRESPGAILRDTVPGLCDEVDHLRAEVERQAVLLRAVRDFPDGDPSRAILMADRIAGEAILRAEAAERALADERAKVARLRALAERILTVHEQVVMDTPEDRDLHDRACSTFRTALAGAADACP